MYLEILLHVVASTQEPSLHSLAYFYMLLSLADVLCAA